MEAMKDDIKDTFIKCVVKEAISLCDPNNPSLTELFRGSTIEDLSQFNFTHQDDKLQLKSPLLSSTLQAVAESAGIERNVKKTKETLIQVWQQQQTSSSPVGHQLWTLTKYWPHLF